MGKTISLAIVFLLAMAPLAAASITVTSPTTTSVWCFGVGQPYSYSITWIRSGAMPDVVKIGLYKPNEPAFPVLPIASGTDNDGLHPWEITSWIPSGPYFIRVETVNPSIIGESPVFIIQQCAAGLPAGSGETYPVAAAIKVLSPNGGENWQMGTTRNITWSKGGTWTGTVKLILLQDGKYKGVIASGLPVAGSFAWKVGQTDKGVFRGVRFKVRAEKEYGMVIPRDPIASESHIFFSIY